MLLPKDNGPSARRLPLLSLVMVFFFTVSGGAYGIEDLIGASGPGIALLLIVITPLIWSLPIGLMSAELSSAIPVRGGYYVWVKQALGPFWGFQEGWWSWFTSFVDMAIYPVLFADYLSTLLAQFFNIRLLEESALAHWVVALLVIWFSTLLNVRGARAVGMSSRLFGVFILAPFAVMSVVGLIRLAQNPVPVWEPIVAPGSELLGAFGLGLFVVMWKFAGWDAVSTLNEEIENPQRNYLRAIGLTIPLVVLAYLLPTIAGLVAVPDPTQWTSGSFPTIAAAVGGAPLGTWLAIGGMVSTVALFNALLLSISRLPFVLAEDGYLPQGITRLHPKFGTPWVSIVVCAVIYSIFSLRAFAFLVVVDVILYAAALFLEFIALIALRVKRPDLARPFRVPGGLPVAIGMTALPTAVLALAVVSQIEFEGVEAVYLSLAALASGPILYLILRRRPDARRGRS
jgi:amino acid transporter